MAMRTASVQLGRHAPILKEKNVVSIFLVCACVIL
jgi:hypothetical protein